MKTFIDLIKESKEYPTGLVIYVDIDNTIAEVPPEKGKKSDYHLCVPIKENIDIVNKLFDASNEIHYWTARGTKTGDDHTELTFNQLKEWGCKYTKLTLGKPFYDLFIDDKCINNFKELDEYLKNFKK